MFIYIYIEFIEVTWNFDKPVIVLTAFGLVLTQFVINTPKYVNECSKCLTFAFHLKITKQLGRSAFLKVC